MSHSLRIAAGLGAVTGLRSMTGVAALSRDLSERWWLGRHATRLEAWLADDTVAATATAFAVGELVADKLPGIPDRIEPAPLLGRGLIGATLGAIVAGPDDRLAGGIIGGAAAITGAYFGWFLRREAGRSTMIPDPVIAIAEDALAVLAALRLVDEL
jgi:uncharacterized membrane protein